MPTDQTLRGGLMMSDAVRELYAAGQTDYALEPIVRVNAAGEPVGRIQDGDAVVFCCRRGDREIQLTEAFVDPHLDQFPRRVFRDLTFVILTLYHEKFKDLPVAFAPTRIQETLGEVVSRAGLRQVRVAESEKFAHVTFFFNGGSYQSFPGEEDICVPSPRGIPFEQLPELSLAQVAGQVEQALARQVDLIVANFANGDVIGHTANCAAKIRCAELVDARLGQVVQAAVRANYRMLITADHGNLEEMINPDGTPHVAHTANPVPCILIDPCAPPVLQGAIPQDAILKDGTLRDGTLADVAPTVLDLLSIPRPAAMSGESLIRGSEQGSLRHLLLLILDGWGFGKADETNPIFLAQTPVWDDLTRRWPGAVLRASGDAVGLQAGKAGNSEAGHMNIGAGRVILQDDMRLDLAMQNGSFTTNETLCRTIQEVLARKSSLHLIGLLTEKSSHGSIEYPLMILRMARSSGLEQVYLHLIFDGRSTQPGSAPALLEKLEARLEEIGVGQIVTGIGRGIALDRDGNYAKTRRAYDALVHGIGKQCAP